MTFVLPIRTSPVIALYVARLGAQLPYVRQSEPVGGPRAARRHDHEKVRAHGRDLLMYLGLGARADGHHDDDRADADDDA